MRFHSLGLWPHNPSDLTSYRNSKTWEELKSLKRFQNSAHMFKNALLNGVSDAIVVSVGDHGIGNN